MQTLVNVKKALGWAIATTIVVAAATPAWAGYQSTKVEGTIGVDVGGVWLAVEHMAPTFRSRIEPKSADAPPFRVAPVPDDLRLLVGDESKGVVVDQILDEPLTGNAGIFKGDVILKVNGKPVATVADFESETKAALEHSKFYLINVLRPSLGYSSAAVMKIFYEARVEEVDGASTIANEDIKITQNDVRLPFADELEATRQEPEFFSLSKEDLARLKDEWWRLPASEPPLFAGGEHRVVASSDYDLGMRQDDNLRDSQFAIVSTMAGASPKGGGKSISIYAVRKVSDDEISGSYVSSTLATAPFPISIDFNGTFTLYKLADFSYADVEFQRAQQEKALGAGDTEDTADVKLAPDVPTNVDENEDDQNAKTTGDVD